MFKKIIKRFFNHKLQRPLNSKCISLTFVKLCGKWYADVPGWKGSIASLEMVSGCDDFLDDLCVNGHFVTLEISTDNPGLEYQAELIHLDAFGGTYKLSKPFEALDGTVKDTIWLCNVTKYVFGDHPKKLYFEQVA